jgi:3'-phosphoadenosine 5'-phosphosulfate (PAPS) 3'-phosphatase
MTDLRRLFEGADAVAVRAAELLLSMQRQDIGRTRKERLDVVTAADLASEKLVVASLRALTPDAAILSEERERADRRTARAGSSSARPHGELRSRPAVILGHPGLSGGRAHKARHHPRRSSRIT